MFRLRAYLINAYLVSFDFVITTLCYVAVLHSELGSERTQTVFQTLRTPVQVSVLGFALLTWISLSFYFGMYRSQRLASPFADLNIMAKVGFAGWIILESASHLAPELAPTRFFLFRFVTTNFLALSLARFALRLAVREIRRRGRNVKQLVLIASPELGRRLNEKIEQRADYGYQIVRSFEYRGAGEDGGADWIEEIHNFLRSVRLDDVILALPYSANEMTARLIAECESQGINVRMVPDLFPLIQTDMRIYELDGIPLVNARLYPAESFGYVVFKRAFDFCVSLAVLVLLSPLYLLIAVLVKLTSPGPVFFIQDRVGLNGRKFRMLKFRTMRHGPSLDPDSQWTVRDVITQFPRGGARAPDDPHITPLGRWLRRSNLDELPQFLNVLKGEMSIVGPRPERPFFLEQFRREVPEYMARHYVKSGITGWAQVNGWRGDTPIPERVAHDLYYIRNWALTFDIKILFLTLLRSFSLGDRKPGVLKP
jgi:exopolysaccharide biosynthesis polyprenyl glycosylphosphotransferase